MFDPTVDGKWLGLSRKSCTTFASSNAASFSMISASLPQLSCTISPEPLTQIHFALLQSQVLTEVYLAALYRVIVLADKRFFFSMAQQPLVGQDFLIVEASRSHLDTPHMVGLLWMSDQPDAETSTWQHTTLTRHRNPCLPAGFEPAIPASQRPQTHALDDKQYLSDKIRTPYATKS
jgi:hypothetical protein